MSGWRLRVRVVPWGYEPLVGRTGYVVKCRQSVLHFPDLGWKVSDRRRPGERGRGHVWSWARSRAESARRLAADFLGEVRKWSGVLVPWSCCWLVFFH